jgi:hypothetical protein
MKSRLLILILFGLLPGIPGAATATESPEPGPEDGGLRLRLVVKPRAGAAGDAYEVRLDVINSSERAVTLRAAWRDDRETGDVRSYLEAAASIETVPAIAPWIGGVQQGKRTLPQPEQVLKPGEVLTVDWQTERRHLKNRVTDPIEVQNPRFPFAGLYSVHTTIDVITDARTVRLRSNEQLVCVGGSRTMPKYTFGRLWSVDPEKRTAILGLGSLHKIAVGDQFEIGNAKSGHWKLTITRVEPGISFGGVEMMTAFRPQPESSMPTPQMDATLIEPKR